MCVQSQAQNTDDGGSATWRVIHGNNVIDDDSHYGYGNQTSQVSSSGSFGSNYGAYSVNSWGKATAQAELKAFTQVSASGAGLGIQPSRINGSASAYFGEYWDIIPSEAYPGGSISSVVDLSWDGSFTINSPGAQFGNPYFNEVGLSVNFNLYEVGDAESEPVPVWNYVSGYLILRANGTDGLGQDFENTNFDTTVFGFDPSNPWVESGNNYDLELDITPEVRPLGEFGYAIEISGDLPFEATVGRRYLATYGLEVYANVTGVEGFAEADFSQTGTVDIATVDPNDGLFVMVPEAASYSLWMSIFVSSLLVARPRQV